MTWVKHYAHPRASDSRPFYTYIGTDEHGEADYTAYIVEQEDGFKATVPNTIGGSTPPYHYTHDTLEAAKEWCIVELVKRRLS